MSRKKSQYTTFDLAGFAAFGAAVLTLLVAALWKKSFFSISVAPPLFVFLGGLFGLLMTIGAHKKGRFVGEFCNVVTRESNPLAFWIALSVSYLFSVGLFVFSVYVAKRS